MGEHSVRAQEVARDLFAAIDAELGDRHFSSTALKFHLAASDVTLSREAAENWVRESVDEGFPNVQYYIEREAPDEVVINLAAYEDSDSQYYP